MRLRVLFSASGDEDDVSGSRNSFPMIAEAARIAAREAVGAVGEHLRLGDLAPTEASALMPFMFIARFGDLSAARDEVLAGLGGDFTTEDLAARFVGLSYLVSANPVPRMNSFEQDTFALFAPADDPLYEASMEAGLDAHDVSWSNRRAFVRGRAAAPSGN